MERNGQNGQNGQYAGSSLGDIETIASKENRCVERVSIGQLRHLVQLLDASDVAEIEVNRAEEGLRLVMRKARAQESGVTGVAAAGVYQVADVVDEASTSDSEPVESRHTITSPLVGIFHTWAKPKGKALVSVGDHVKVGQRVGTIQSLNVLNEVETTIAGRVVEVLVQEGQAVEYGQHLLVIDSSEEA